MERIPSNCSPGAECITIAEDGQAQLQGWRCSACGEVFVAPARGCARCCAPGTLQPTALALRGKVYNYTIVHRSFPGVSTPFVSAIVELEGGGVLRGNLKEVEPKFEAIPFDLPVDVELHDSGQTDAEGRPYIIYSFKPREISA